MGSQGPQIYKKISKASKSRICLGISRLQAFYIYPWESETLQNQKKESFKRHDFISSTCITIGATLLKPDSLSLPQTTRTISDWIRLYTHFGFISFEADKAENVAGWWILSHNKCKLTANWAVQEISSRYRFTLSCFSTVAICLWSQTTCKNV